MDSKEIVVCAYVTFSTINQLCFHYIKCHNILIQVHHVHLKDVKIRKLKLLRLESTEMVFLFCPNRINFMYQNIHLNTELTNLI